jgi:hypothetical protein
MVFDLAFDPPVPPNTSLIFGRNSAAIPAKYRLASAKRSGRNRVKNHNLLDGLH